MVAYGLYLVHFFGIDHFVSTVSARTVTMRQVFELVLALGIKAVQRLKNLPDKTFPDVEVQLLAELTLRELMLVIAGMNLSHLVTDTLPQCDLKSRTLQLDQDPDPLSSTMEF